MVEPRENDARSVLRVNEVRGVFAQKAHFSEVILMLEVLLKAVLEPVGNVLAVE